MAKVKIEGFLEQLEAEMKKALSSTLRQHFEGRDYAEKEVYATLRKQIMDKCDSWEHLPNKYVR